jgi:glycosyltransferase involved in cell wall biosynthesis
MARKTHVLYLHSQAGFGADSVIHAHIARCLDRERFVVHVACAPGDGGQESASFARFSAIPDVRLRATQVAPGIRRRSAAELAASLRGALLAPREYVALRKYIVDYGIRIIHGTDRPRDATYAVTLGRLTGAKSIVHVHVKWSNEYSAPARWGVQHADAAFSISRYVTDTIAAMGKPRAQIHTILNAIEPSEWDPNVDGSGVRAEFGIPPAAPLLASVSRLFSWKGQRELVRALELVKAQVPDVYLLIVGADERHVHGGSFTDELKELARTLGVDDRVIFTGLRRDVPRIMAACDVFSLPSFEEPFGLVFLEAMAMRRPVAAVNNGGTPEVVEHGRSGLLSEAWDIEGLARNLVTLLRDPDLRRSMGDYGRSRVLHAFNAQRMADDTAAAYERLLAS